jgi:hypothetical protein
MRTDQSKRLKEVERENAHLNKLVADPALDNSILKEAISGNHWARPRNAWPSSIFATRLVQIVFLIAALAV